MYKLFMVLQSLHLTFDFLIFLLANITIITKATLDGALGGAFGILVLNSLHSMGSKYFMMELTGYHNKVYTSHGFLSLTIEA